MTSCLLSRLSAPNTKVLLAFTAFKDSISAEKLCEVVANRLLTHNSTLKISQFPISDGGDGFLGSIEGVLSRQNVHFERQKTVVLGPLGTPITGQFSLIRPKNRENERIAVIEIAKISGLELVPKELRNVFNTTNHGVGELLTSLHMNGIREIILGLGGTSTIDAGLSILYALPCFRFTFDDARQPAFLTGADLQHITKIEKNENYVEWRNVKITAACDVKNTLLGPLGAVYCFGEQKGLSGDQAEMYESNMAQLALITGDINRIRDLATMPHSGAAGGILVGLNGAFPSSTAVSGFELLSNLGGLEAILHTADVVFTGEGKYDDQTRLGKVVSQIRKKRPDSVIICGQNATSDRNLVYDLTEKYGFLESITTPEATIGRLIDEIMKGNARL